MGKCSLCLSPSDQLVFVGGIVSVHPSVVDVPFVPPEKIPRALLTSPGGPMPVDDRHVSTHDFMGQSGCFL